MPPLEHSTPVRSRRQWARLALPYVLAAAGLIGVGAPAGLAQGAPSPGLPLDELLNRVSRRVAQWSTRATTVVSTETVWIQPLGMNLTPSGVPRRLVHELRVSWNEPGTARGAPEPISVLRELLSVNGRRPRAGDDAGCMDPKPVSPEPLAMFLPERLAESEFSVAGNGRANGRRALLIDYRGSAALPAEVVWTGDCVTVSLPGRSRGRIWVDAETYDILRVDDRLVGRFEFEVPREHVRRGATSSMVIERAESSIRYRPVHFEDPAETLMLPTDIDTVTVVRGNGVQRMRITQRLSEHRRFLTGGRMLD